MRTRLTFRRLGFATSYLVASALVLGPTRVNLIHCRSLLVKQLELASKRPLQSTDHTPPLHLLVGRLDTLRERSAGDPRSTSPPPLVAGIDPEARSALEALRNDRASAVRARKLTMCSGALG